MGIGFANIVRKGSIGVISASGSGLQEFTCQVHNAGFGISHAIGTGGRDLSDKIEGVTTLTALDALESDPHTKVIAILSKPPGVKTIAKLGKRFRITSYNVCYTKLLRHQPDSIVVLGGDCLVDLAPFNYLNEKYDGNLGIIWVDAHPDILIPEQYNHAHAMVLGNLMGIGDDEFKAVVNVITSYSIHYTKLYDEKLVMLTIKQYRFT